jgi:TctA family transporter
MKLLDIAVNTAISEALGWTLFHSLWQAAIIALDLLAILASVRLPRVRYVTGCIAMMAMLGSFAINELTRYVAEMITINI